MLTTPTRPVVLTSRPPLHLASVLLKVCCTTASRFSQGCTYPEPRQTSRDICQDRELHGAQREVNRRADLRHQQKTYHWFLTIKDLIRHANSRVRIHRYGSNHTLFKPYPRLRSRRSNLQQMSLDVNDPIGFICPCTMIIPPFKHNYYLSPFLHALTNNELRLLNHELCIKIKSLNT